jgi:Raf kinase inhibitor-like YbhB/YbcL family protein
MLAAVCMLAAGCIGPSGEETMATQTGAKLQVRSNAFQDGDEIPQQYTCDGAGVSPQLAWSGAPAETQAFALLVTDPDARNYVHWVVTDIPAVATMIDEGASGTDVGGTEGTNSGGGVGWTGPCPPSGTHRYVFSVYALDAALGLPVTPDAAALRDALQSHVLAEGQLSGRYTRASS